VQHHFIALNVYPCRSVRSAVSVFQRLQFNGIIRVEGPRVLNDR